MAFRATFDCLWCGRRHAAADVDDLSGWAQLCPACLERAGTNPFLRYRVRRAIADRRTARDGPAAPAKPGPQEPAPTTGPGEVDSATTSGAAEAGSEIDPGGAPPTDADPG